MMKRPSLSVGRSSPSVIFVLLGREVGWLAGWLAGSLIRISRLDDCMMIAETRWLDSEKPRLKPFS